jgi:glycine/D-amino acid oxidase-like deaminating enzyme
MTDSRGAAALAAKAAVDGPAAANVEEAKEAEFVAAWNTFQRINGRKPINVKQGGGSWAAAGNALACVQVNALTAQRGMGRLISHSVIAPGKKWFDDGTQMPAHQTLGGHYPRPTDPELMRHYLEQRRMFATYFVGGNGLTPRDEGWCPLHDEENRLVVLRKDLEGTFVRLSERLNEGVDEAAHYLKVESDDSHLQCFLACLRAAPDKLSLLEATLIRCRDDELEGVSAGDRDDVQAEERKSRDEVEAEEEDSYDIRRWRSCKKALGVEVPQSFKAFFNSYVNQFKLGELQEMYEQDQRTYETICSEHPGLRQGACINYWLEPRHIERLAEAGEIDGQYVGAVCWTAEPRAIIDRLQQDLAAVVSSSNDSFGSPVTAVQSLLGDRDGSVEVSTENSVYQCDQVILAAGSANSQLHENPPIITKRRKVGVEWTVTEGNDDASPGAVIMAFGPGAIRTRLSGGAMFSTCSREGTVSDEEYREQKSRGEGSFQCWLQDKGRAVLAGALENFPKYKALYNAGNINIEKVTIGEIIVVNNTPQTAVDLDSPGETRLHARQPVPIVTAGKVTASYLTKFSLMVAMGQDVVMSVSQQHIDKVLREAVEKEELTLDEAERCHHLISEDLAACFGGATLAEEVEEKRRTNAAVMAQRMATEAANREKERESCAQDEEIAKVLVLRELALLVIKSRVVVELYQRKVNDLVDSWPTPYQKPADDWVDSWPTPYQQPVSQGGVNPPSINDHLPAGADVTRPLALRDSMPSMPFKSIEVGGS